MTPEQAKELATASQRLWGIGAPIFMTHSKRPDVLYAVLGHSKVKIDGEWIETICYQHDGNIYNRRPEDMAKFTLVV